MADNNNNNNNNDKPDIIGDVDLTKDVNSKLYPLCCDIITEMSEVQKTIADRPQTNIFNRRAFAMNRSAVIANLAISIQKMKKTVEKFEAAQTRLEEYEKKEVIGNYANWLMRMVAQEQRNPESKCEPPGTDRSLKTCSPERLNNIKLAAVFIARYRPELISEIQLTITHQTQFSSLVARYIKENHKSVYEDYHVVCHLMEHDGKLIRKLAKLMNDVEHGISYAKHDLEWKAEKEAKKQKMNK